VCCRYLLFGGVPPNDSTWRVRNACAGIPIPASIGHTAWDVGERSTRRYRWSGGICALRVASHARSHAGAEKTLPSSGVTRYGGSVADAGCRHARRHSAPKALSRWRGVTWDGQRRDIHLIAWRPHRHAQQHTALIMSISTALSWALLCLSVQIMNPSFGIASADYWFVAANVAHLLMGCSPALTATLNLFLRGFGCLRH